MHSETGDMARARAADLIHEIVSAAYRLGGSSSVTTYRPPTFLSGLLRATET